MTRKKTNYRRKRPAKTEDLRDIEVAKKMIKIYQSAEDRNLEFDLSFDTVKKLLQEPKCYYTDKTFDETGQFARSFDRIDSNKGYVEGNVVACTIDINSKKSNLSFEEIELLYNKLHHIQAETEKAPDIEEDLEEDDEVKT